ncbi:lipase family protein [Kosakonia sp.]|uniref:lipase family protein n=1 Tax=Kosakonia sp. TaxID=1916651 RepID=UPI0028AE9248|nr:lipase family protein [Kosakonia sp.]
MKVCRYLNCAICALTMWVNGANAWSNALPVGPAAGDQTLSPFYIWDGALPDKPGVMLREEPIPGQPDITDASEITRILYTSQDKRWNAGIVPVSGTLWLPKGHAPKGGWPLVAWAHGTLGVADSCAPSWTNPTPRDAHYINQWLKHGFAVVATDYQGLGGPGPHPYMNWEAEGRSVLDSVRAVLSSTPQLANNLVISGQSQGSGASLGASLLAPDYAPELQLRATIATGVVATFPDGPIKPGSARPEQRDPARFTLLRIIGGSLPDGAPPAEKWVTDQGAKMLALARTSCMPELGRYERHEKLTGDTVFIGGTKQVESTLLAVTDMPVKTFPAPLFTATGLADHTLSPHHQYAAIAALCAGGNAVEWKTYPGITHNGVVNVAFDDELKFVRGVMENAPQSNSCGSLQAPGELQQPLKGVPFNR